MQRNHLSAKARTLLTGLQKTGIDFSSFGGNPGRVWRALDEGALHGMTTEQLATLCDTEDGTNPFSELAAHSASPEHQELLGMAYMLLELFCSSSGDCFGQAGTMLGTIRAKTEGRDVANNEDMDFAWGCLSTVW
jgi:hypothetical protein